jgi:hypothetical protein
MLPVPVPHEDRFGTPEDKAVEDMLSPEFWKLWTETGMRNRAAFEKVFRPVCVVCWAVQLSFLADRRGCDLSSRTTRSGLGKIMTVSFTQASASRCASFPALVARSTR